MATPTSRTLRTRRRCSSGSTGGDAASSRSRITPTAARELGEWGSQWLPLLPKPGASLSKLKPRQLASPPTRTADVKERDASHRPTKSGGTAIVTVGATGAAKILHALRPKVLPPWDEPIRAALGLDGSRDSYLTYLVDVQRHVRDIEAEAAARGITNVPRVLGRPRSSLPKMIDEYYWITLTRRLVPPSGSR